jgi:hypothetical protein
MKQRGKAQAKKPAATDKPKPKPVKAPKQAKLAHRAKAQ